MKKVLVAPLDWGIGHAARCVPVIRTLLEQNVMVYIAAHGRGEKLLREEFPSLTFLHSPHSAISYAASGKMIWKMTKQIPKILWGIILEHRWIKQAVQEYHLDGVISDNRYGLFCKNSYTVFLTHQVQIKAPKPWLETMLFEIVTWFIRRYDECWIIDHAKPPFMAGSLSHPHRQLPKNCCHIGILSRFSNLLPTTTTASVPILVLLSGPEPSRTIVEQKILAALPKTNHTVAFVRGCPEVAEELEMQNQITFYNHLPSHLLAPLIANADYIICRSGYSTIMDIAAIGSQASLLFIPTTGQTEQEYLAKLHAKQGSAYAEEEKSNNLIAFINKEKKSLKPPRRQSCLNSKIQAFLTKAAAQKPLNGKS